MVGWHDPGISTRRLMPEPGWSTWTTRRSRHCDACTRPGGCWRQRDDREGADALPRLVPRRQLGFGASLFITESEVNGLASPPVHDVMVVFGFGYGLDVLAAAAWLHRPRLVYWGDIDTHGFAILARFRANFPGVESILIDERTLLAHRRLWVGEKQPFLGEPQRLSESECALFDDMKRNRYGENASFEQEIILYRHVLSALER
jgi:hypothetical protein